jgi:hypothetical protein
MKGSGFAKAVPPVHSRGRFFLGLRWVRQTQKTKSFNRKNHGSDNQRNHLIIKINGSEIAIGIEAETPEWSPHFYQWGRNEELQRIARAKGIAHNLSELEF